MNKTVYLRDEEGPIWERARELAGDRLSPVIVEALKQFIVLKEGEVKGFERIQTEFNDSDDHQIPKKKAFYGKWIFPPDNPYVIKMGEAEHFMAVAVTAKGSAVFYTWAEGGEAKVDVKFTVYSSLEEAAASWFVHHAALRAIEKLGVPVEELDI
jgi:hypothetical protein